jgi:hypothetical protein
MASSVNFDLFQGDSFQLRVIYKDSNGDPVDLTDYSAVCSVRDSFGGKTRCAQVEVGDGIEIVNEEGLIIINFSPDRTLSFTVPKAVWQLQVIEPDGETTKTIAYGVLSVQKAAAY